MKREAVLKHCVSVGSVRRWSPLSNGAPHIPGTMGEGRAGNGGGGGLDMGQMKMHIFVFKEFKAALYHRCRSIVSFIIFIKNDFFFLFFFNSAKRTQFTLSAAPLRSHQPTTLDPVFGLVFLALSHASCGCPYFYLMKC